MQLADDLSKAIDSVYVPIREASAPLLSSAGGFLSGALYVLFSLATLYLVLMAIINAYRFISSTIDSKRH